MFARHIALCLIHVGIAFTAATASAQTCAPSTACDFARDSDLVQGNACWHKFWGTPDYGPLGINMWSMKTATNVVYGEAVEESFTSHLTPGETYLLTYSVKLNGTVTPSAFYARLIHSADQPTYYASGPGTGNPVPTIPTNVAPIIDEVPTPAWNGGNFIVRRVVFQATGDFDSIFFYPYHTGYQPASVGLGSVSITPLRLDVPPTVCKGYDIDYELECEVPVNPVTGVDDASYLWSISDCHGTDYGVSTEPVLTDMGTCLTTTYTLDLSFTNPTSTTSFSGTSALFSGFSISGPSNTCGGNATYTISTVQPGVTYMWHVEPYEGPTVWHAFTGTSFNVSWCGRMAGGKVVVRAIPEGGCVEDRVKVVGGCAYIPNTCFVVGPSIPSSL